MLIFLELADCEDQYSFKIVFHGAGSRTYTLCADSQDIMEDWMKALSCASYDYMKLMVSELQRQLDELIGKKNLQIEIINRSITTVNNTKLKGVGGKISRKMSLGLWIFCLLCTFCMDLSQTTYS